MTDDPLSHFNRTGDAHIVDIVNKPESRRSASAQAVIHMHRDTFDRIVAGMIGKGDVLAVARLAAITATKQTSGLIPLCHPVRLTHVDVNFECDPQGPQIRSTVTVQAIDRTGPEMEAMTGASVAALTIYDMCKAMDRGMRITGVQLLAKSGGKSGAWTRDSPVEPT